MRIVAGIVVAAIVLWVWGFIVWGFGPYQTAIWQAPSDAPAAGEVLKEHFPSNGVWFVPPNTGDTEQMSAAYEAGPVAFVHMMKVDGRPMMDASIMAKGFVHNLLVILCLAGLLLMLKKALPTWGSRVLFGLVAGFTAAFLIDGGAVVWWQYDLVWKLYMGIYDVSVYVIVCAVLGAFIPKGDATAQA